MFSKGQHWQCEGSRYGKGAQPHRSAIQHLRLGLQPWVSCCRHPVADHVQEIWSEDAVCDDVHMGYHGYALPSKTNRSLKLITACSDRLRSCKAMGTARCMPFAGRHLRIRIHRRSCIPHRHVLLQARVLDPLRLLLHVDNHRWRRQWVHLVAPGQDGWYCWVCCVEMVSSTA
jgi:hypothetical protein